jgi:glycosyltransferase involved in cell wall biosynthesis
MNGVSILIPTHNRARILGQTLESLSQLEAPSGVPVEVVVVANACTDDTVAVAEAMFATLPFEGKCVVEPRANLSIARNTAVRHSQYEICAMLDDDVWVDRRWLAATVEAYRDPEVAIIAGHIELWWKDVTRPAWFTPMMDSLLTQKDFGAAPRRMLSPFDAAGANFSFRRAVFDRIGPYVEGLGRTGGNVGLSSEEAEFLQRALSAGYHMYYFPAVSVKHWVAPTRIEMAYLERVSFANAASRTMIKPRFGPRAVVRCAAGSGGLYALHLLRGMYYRLRGNRAEQSASKLRMAGSRGAAYGLWLRLTGRSPMRFAGAPAISASPETSCAR